MTTHVSSLTGAQGQSQILRQACQDPDLLERLVNTVGLKIFSTEDIQKEFTNAWETRRFAIVVILLNGGFDITQTLLTAASSVDQCDVLAKLKRKGLDVAGVICRGLQEGHVPTIKKLIESKCVGGLTETELTEKMLKTPGIDLGKIPKIRSYYRGNSPTVELDSFTKTIVAARFVPQLVQPSGNRGDEIMALFHTYEVHITDTTFPESALDSGVITRIEMQVELESGGEIEEKGVFGRKIYTVESSWEPQVDRESLHSIYELAGQPAEKIASYQRTKLRQEAKALSPAKPVEAEDQNDYELITGFFSQESATDLSLFPRLLSLVSLTPDAFLELPEDEKQRMSECIYLQSMRIYQRLVLKYPELLCSMVKYGLSKYAPQLYKNVADTVVSTKVQQIQALKDKRIVVKALMMEKLYGVIHFVYGIIEKNMIQSGNPSNPYDYKLLKVQYKVNITDKLDNTVVYTRSLTQ